MKTSSKLFIPGLIAITILGLQMQTQVFAQGQAEKKIFYELRDALRNKLDNNQSPVTPAQNQSPPVSVQQPVAQPPTLSQPLSQPVGAASGLQERAKQEIEIMLDKKLGTNLSNQVNPQTPQIPPLNSNIAPVSNQPAVAVPAGQQPAQGNGFNFSNLAGELKDLKVPEKYKQDYYRYRNKVKDLVK